MQLTHPTEREFLSDEQKAAVLAELARVLESAAFGGSRRCCRLLEYSVHQVLEGCGHEELKERTIGIEALQRPPDYDTGEDAIVRVTANEVRKRLAQYYQGAGVSANPVIALPPGSYAAVFQWQAAPLPAAPALPESQPATFPKQRRIRWSIAAAAVVLLAGGAVVWHAMAVRIVPSIHAASAYSTSGKTDALWSSIFDSGKKTNIVVSDAVYREIQHFLGRDVSLSEYLAPGYPQSLLAAAKPEAKWAVEFLGRQQTTSVGSATLGARLMTFGARMGGDPVIRYPRHINAREFNTDNFILLGSRLSIPWGELFEPSLNFPLLTDAATHTFYLGNRAPRPGEPAEYRESADHQETYADIAVLPNLGGTGTVLMLNGIDMTAAEAAGAFALNGSLSAALAAIQGGSRHAEILIRVRSIGGTVESTEVVAARPIGRK